MRSTDRMKEVLWIQIKAGVVRHTLWSLVLAQSCVLDALGSGGLWGVWNII